MKTFLTFLAVIIFFIIIIIGIMLFIKVTSTKVSTAIKKKLFKKPPPPINNKIIKLTDKEISQNTIDLFNYKHSKFLKNLENSIEFCIDNHKFLLADNISKYKILYIDLYKLKLKIEKNSNEDFLLKSIQLDNLNNIIQKMN